VSTQTERRPDAYDLADAVVDMALRLAEAERRQANAWRSLPDGADKRAEMQRWERAARRRLRALRRLTNALRDLPKKEEK
jgi:uncharacterized protein YukE